MTVKESIRKLKLDHDNRLIGEVELGLVKLINDSSVNEILTEIISQYSGVKEAIRFFESISTKYNKRKVNLAEKAIETNQLPKEYYRFLSPGQKDKIVAKGRIEELHIPLEELISDSWIPFHNLADLKLHRFSSREVADKLELITPRIRNWINWVEHKDKSLSKTATKPQFWPDEASGEMLLGLKALIKRGKDFSEMKDEKGIEIER